jgi:cysteinyl-tRNA synthetase
MPVRLFNSYSRELENFTPIDPAGKAVKMYTCGPTVYNHAHIGNFRAYISRSAAAASGGTRLHR